MNTHLFLHSRQTNPISGIKTDQQISTACFPFSTSNFHFFDNWHLLFIWTHHFRHINSSLLCWIWGIITFSSGGHRQSQATNAFHTFLIGKLKTAALFPAPRHALPSHITSSLEPVTIGFAFTARRVRAFALFTTNFSLNAYSNL